MKALTCPVPAAAAIADEFAVGAGGALTPIGSVTVPGGADRDVAGLPAVQAETRTAITTAAAAPRRE